MQPASEVIVMRAEAIVRTAMTGVLLALAMALGACAQRQQPPSTYGEAMQQRGEVNKEVGEKWQRGNDKVQRGTRMIEDSQKDQAEGERMVREGRNEMREAEEEGRRVRQQPVSTEPTRPAPADTPKPWPQY